MLFPLFQRRHIKVQVMTGSFFYSLSSLSRSLDCTLMSNSIFIAHVMLMADESADCDADDKDGRKNLCIRKSRWRIEVVP